jgi:hypothetical protein
MIFYLKINFVSLIPKFLLGGVIFFKEIENRSTPSKLKTFFVGFKHFSEPHIAENALPCWLNRAESITREWDLWPIYKSRR